MVVLLVFWVVLAIAQKERRRMTMAAQQLRMKSIDCQPGDIIFQSFSCWSNHLIEAMTRLPFVHVGVVIGTASDGRPIMWDISPTFHCRAQCLDTYVAKAGRHCAVLRMRQNKRDHVKYWDVEPFRRALFERTTSDVIVTWLRGTRPEECNRMICVEMAVAMLQHNLGILVDSPRIMSAAEFLGQLQQLPEWFHPLLVPLDP